jgi:hypothetical protein
MVTQNCHPDDKGLSHSKTLSLKTVIRMMKGKINPFLDEGPGEDTGNSSGKGEEAQMRAQRSPRVIVGVLDAIAIAIALAAA